MKKFFYFLCIITLLQSCSQTDELFGPQEKESTNFPEHFQQYGEQFEKEFTNALKNLNEMGVDYSNADDSDSFKEQFYKDWYNANPNIGQNILTRSQMQMDPSVFTERISNLTEIQIQFINRIVDESENSSSYSDFYSRIMNINKDIYETVPKIEQERLLYITSTLYYGMNAIQSMEQKGQMIRTPQNAMQLPLIKTRSESGSIPIPWGFTCRRFLTTVWTIAIGEPTPVGEVVAGVITVFIAGAWLYEVVVCRKESVDIAMCIDKYEKCMSTSWGVPNSGGWGYTMCSRCFEYCRAQGVWDCPRPI